MRKQGDVIGNAEGWTALHSGTAQSDRLDLDFDVSFFANLSQPGLEFFIKAA